MKKYHLTFFILCSLLPAFIFAQETSKITFQVDATSITENAADTILNLGVRGSLSPLTWVNGNKLTDDNRDGIYETTIEFTATDIPDLYFKYVLNEVEWESGDARKIRVHSQTLHDTFQYVKPAPNPFQKFIGEWTLKDDLFFQRNEGTVNDTVVIPNHYTRCSEVNSNHSLLWEVDATSARGHILWVLDRAQQKVRHVSSFMPSRAGVGEGTVDENGNIRLKLTFEGEPENTYRLYEYNWISASEYELRSTQYDANDQPTGSFYGGVFIRKEANVTSVENEITQLNQRLSDAYKNKNVTALMQLYDNEITYTPEYKSAIFSKTQLTQFYKDWWQVTNVLDYQKKRYEIQTYGKYVVEIGHFSLDYKTETTTFSNYSGMYLSLWRRNTAGELRIIAEGFCSETYITPDQVPYASVTVLPQTIPTHAISPTLQAEVDLANQSVITAVKKGDGKARSAGFTEDAIYVHHFNEMMVGKKVIKPYLLKVYRPEANLYTQHQLGRIYDLGEYVFIHGHYQGGWGDPTAGGGTFSGNMLNVRRRMADGTLKTYRQFTNNDR